MTQASPTMEEKRAAIQATRGGWADATDDEIVMLWRSMSEEDRYFALQCLKGESEHEPDDNDQPES
jgi:hypothetical protein